MGTRLVTPYTLLALDESEEAEAEEEEEAEAAAVAADGLSLGARLLDRSRTLSSVSLPASLVSIAAPGAFTPAFTPHRAQHSTDRISHSLEPAVSSTQR
jgi:hypothetical protein